MVENLVLGIVSGLISGFIVAVASWLFSYWHKAPLELIHIAERRAVLRNNRLRPVVIGGAWALGIGDVLFRPDGFRGGKGGFYIAGFGEFIVGTNHIAPGQSAEIVYRHVPVEKNSMKRIRLEEKISWKLRQLRFAHRIFLNGE